MFSTPAITLTNSAEKTSAMAETSETKTTGEINEDDRESEQEQKPEQEHEELEATDGARVADFGTAAEALTDIFDIDGRRGETITDLHTTTTDDGRQLVATVEKSRSTMLSHRLNSAKRTGRRVGGGATVLAALAVVVYIVLTARRLLSSDGSDAHEDDEGDSQPAENDEPAGSEGPSE
jgi:hypothetical protein